MTYLLCSELGIKPCSLADLLTYIDGGPKSEVIVLWHVRNQFKSINLTALIYLIVSNSLMC